MNVMKGLACDTEGEAEQAGTVQLGEEMARPKRLKTLDRSMKRRQNQTLPGCIQ